MDKNFWHDRWNSGRIGFHRPDVHPFLERYVPRLAVRKGDTVFVPLCGKSLDMLWLRQKGLRVTGVEISPVAVSAFFEENGLAVTFQNVQAGELYFTDGIEIYCADFFAMGTDEVSSCQAIYDRAALIAFPGDQRRTYTEHLIRIAPPLARILLVILEYEQSQMDGPPFSVTCSEVDQMFGSAYDIEVLETIDALGESPHFRERGLTSLRESALLLTPR